MKIIKLLLFLLFVTFFFQTCHEKNVNMNSHLTLDDYNSLDTFSYHLNSRKIWSEIDSLIKHDPDSMTADYRTRSLYANHREFLWIDRKGMDSRADTLLHCLQKVKSIGFSLEKFGIPQLENDLKCFRSLDFDAGRNINAVAARIEYNLTKAYLRYVIGQRFGFMNPTSTFNHLDIREQEGDKISYQTLFDIKIDHVDNAFIALAIQKIHQDSIGSFIQSVEPQNELYLSFKDSLQKDNLNAADRKKILVNMERSRWRVPDSPQKYDKYVLVNVPSYHLLAVDGDKQLEMRTAFGSNDHKTPLMISQLKRMDINPQWIMPRSIIKKSIIPRLGNYSYFARNQYFIRNRKTGENIDVRRVSGSMLTSGDYFVMQKGGDGNAMGRIVFRFDNNLSIFLHDTSSRGVFNQEERDVSHGCVRVEKPFDLAVFLLNEKDEKKIESIRYSMNADVSPIGVPTEDMSAQMKAVSDTLKRKKLISSVSIKPNVPIFIYYYTLYPNTEGHLVAYKDVYGYDNIVYRHLKNYI